MTTISGYHHVALTVSDLDASRAWYEAVFPLDVAFAEPGDARRAVVYRLAGDPALMFGLVEHTGTDGGVFSPQRTGLDHLAFSVPTRDDLDRWVERLDDLGVVHSGAIDVPPGAILNFADPDGIALALFWDRH